MSRTAITPDECLNLVRARIASLPTGETPCIIAVAGPSGAGKSYLAERLAADTGGKRLSQDDYYLGRKRMKDDNFDHPDALDLPLLKAHLRALKRGKTVSKPCYRYACSKRTGTVPFVPSRILILEGLYALAPALRQESTIRIYITAPEKVRFERRLERDVMVRGIEAAQVRRQWEQMVLPMLKRFGLAQQQAADLIVSNP